MRSKEQAIFEEVIFNYNPKFAIGTALRQCAQEDPSDFNVTRLVEKTINHCCGLVVESDEHHDAVSATGIKFEHKTASVLIKPAHNSKNSYPCKITNCMSGSGVAKTGHLCVVMYNPHYNNGDIDYFFIPSEKVEGLVTVEVGKPSAIKGTWNRQSFYTDKLGRYQVDSFEELIDKIHLASSGGTHTYETLFPKTSVSFDAFFA
jgi:hypothetical protein